MLLNRKGSSNLTTLVIVLIVVALFANFSIFSKIMTKNVPEADYSKYQSSAGKDEKQPELSAEELRAKDIAENYTDITAKTADTKCGELVLVNTSCIYDFNARTSLFPQEFPESIFTSKTDNYTVKNVNISLIPTAVTALNSLIDDFAAATGHKDLLIVDAFRSYETQQKVLDAKIAQYGQEQGKLIAQQPGASEHHTGYALDLSLYINGKTADYDGTGDYEWITNNCYKYGFVIRYPQGKTGVTGIDYEPWHLRYVGKAHAYYMTKNNLCLEEYIDKLSYYPLDSDRLAITTDDGQSYEVYAVPVSTDAAVVKVPKSQTYTLSGDNNGHIIVTVAKTQPAAPETSEPDTAAPDAE